MKEVKNTSKIGRISTLQIYLSYMKYLE